MPVGYSMSSLEPAEGGVICPAYFVNLFLFNNSHKYIIPPAIARRIIPIPTLYIFVIIFLTSFHLGGDKLFCFVAKLRFGVPTKAKKGGLKHNNNHIERYNQDIKDRIKTMRNFGSAKGANHFLNLKHIIHNFVNPHMQLKGKTPAEAAGIDLKLERKKLLNMIKFMAKTHITKR